MPSLDDEERNLPLDSEEPPSVESFMDLRVPYKTENLLSSLLRILIIKSVLSIRMPRPLWIVGSLIYIKDYRL
jgi:hypothetical protein